MQPRLFEETGIRVPTRFVPQYPAEFRDTMLKTIGIWQRRDLLGQLESHYLATGLVLGVLQSYTRRGTDSLDQPEFLNWITSFMSLHLCEALSVSDMAERASLSPSRFSQVFRDRFGRPPHQPSGTHTCLRVGDMGRGASGRRGSDGPRTSWPGTSRHRVAA